MSSALRSTVLNTEPLTPGICEWCGQDTDPVNAYCCLTCEAQGTRLEAVQGRMVVRAMKVWRRYRGAKESPGAEGFAKVCELIDRFNRSDRLRREEMGRQRRAKEAEEKINANARSAKPADSDRPGTSVHRKKEERKLGIQVPQVQIDALAQPPDDSRKA